jgi:hypothetical protein
LIVRTTSLIDVDNTLLDNDAAKVEIDQRLADLLGDEGRVLFWGAYEAVRAEFGVVDIPRTIARAVAELDDRSVHRPLAELFMTFPFRDYIYPGALETLAFLRTLGPVVILSDGDPVFQPVKIARSGLATAVDGYVLVFPHKEEHLLELAAAFPADRFLLIEDKPTVIEGMTERAEELGAPLETILVRQGKYAAQIGADWAVATHAVETIGDVRQVVKGEG